MTACAMLTGIDPVTPFTWLFAAYVVFGLGFGLVNAPITNAAVSGMPRAQAGVASAIASTSRQIGQTLGVAVCGALVTSRVGGSVHGGLATVSHAGLVGPHRLWRRRAPPRLRGHLALGARHGAADGGRAQSREPDRAAGGGMNAPRSGATPTRHDRPPLPPSTSAPARSGPACATSCSTTSGGAKSPMPSA